MLRIPTPADVAAAPDAARPLWEERDLQSEEGARSDTLAVAEART